MQPDKTRKSYATGWRKPTHGQLLASLKPIITKGAFSLVWVNPNEPIIIPEEEDDDPEDRIED